jgi:exosortase A
MPPSRLLHDRIRPGATPWQRSLPWLAGVWGWLLVLARREWAEMAHQWWFIESYSHILLVPAIIAWLAWERRHDLARLDPRASWLGVAGVAACLLLWLGGRVSGVNLVAHAGAVGMLAAAVVAVLGVRIAAVLLLPLAFMVFFVPFGQEIVPPLQQLTARLAIALTHASGVPARIDGIHIDTPAGLFIVAEACSGVRFLVAAIALGVLVCFTAFDSWTRRAAFMAASVVVPLLANGVRAWGTIYIAQSQGVEFARAVDHIVYGWVFFALVLALLIGGASPFFQRLPEDAGWSFDEVERLPLMRHLTRLDTRTSPALAAIFVLACLALIAASVLSV